MISAVTSKSVYYIGETHEDSLPYLSYDVTKIYSPKGTISRVIGLSLYWLAAEQSLSTEKEIQVSLVSEVDGSFEGIIQQVRIVGLDQKSVKYEYGETSNHSKVTPTDNIAFHSQIKNLSFTEDKPLQISFYNNMGYDTTSKREFRLFVEREVIK